GQVEPSVTLSGIDPTRAELFGGVKATDGNTIDLAALPADQIVISEKTADQIDAAAGDVITIYLDNAPHTWTVAAVAENGTLVGWRDSAMSMVMPLDRVQELTGQPDTLTGIAISN